MATKTKRRDATGLKWREGWIVERPRTDGTVAYQANWWEGTGTTARKVAKSFGSRSDAEDHLRTTLRAKEQGTYRSPSIMTVSELVAEYIDRSSSRISERTMRTYRDRAASMIDPTIGKRKLETVKPLDVQRWIDQLVKASWSPSTIRAAVAVLMGALREAALLGITDRHLGQGIRRPTIGHQTSTTWSELEVKQVLKKVKGDVLFDALYCVAIATGMRPGELRGLKWDDVNLDQGTITVRRTVTKGVDGAEVIVDRTKSKQSRAVAISPAIVEKLRWHRVRQLERQVASDVWQQTGVVFDRGDGHWLYQSQWLRFHIDLCRRAEVPRIRHHDLRHSSASLELAAGTHPKIVSERLGHSTVSMTLDRYSHVNPDLQRSAARALSDRLMVEDDDQFVSAIESV